MNILVLSLKRYESSPVAEFLDQALFEMPALGWIQSDETWMLRLLSAVFKGKPAWPVPIAEAQRACPKKEICR